MKITTILFDFDGVITNTEPLYDIFFDELADKYQLGVDNFAEEIKGRRLADALHIQYSWFPDDLKRKIIDETTEFELKMDFPLVPGVMDFINYLKEQKYKIGLVTSSIEEKMYIAMNKLQLNGVFDTEVMAGRITRGKPDPMCYLLAAEDLQAAPSACLVFEDSLAGVQAGVDAGMQVVGVSTSVSEKQLQAKVPYIIPDFSDLEMIKSYLK